MLTKSTFKSWYISELILGIPQLPSAMFEHEIAADLTLLNTKCVPCSTANGMHRMSYETNQIARSVYQQQHWLACLYIGMYPMVSAKVSVKRSVAAGIFSVCKG